MWFIVSILGLTLAATCFVKWVDATVKIEQILHEELDKNDSKDNSENG
jgi:hypothetical protein